MPDTHGRNSRRRRILVLTPRDPYPVIGGDRVRIYGLARELSRNHDLTLLTLCRSAAERDAPLPRDGVFSRVIRIALPPWRSWLNCAGALLTGGSLQVAYFHSRQFAAAAQALAPDHDAVLAHLIRTADYTRNLRVPRILEMTDAISLSMGRAAALKHRRFDPRRIIYGIEARRIIARERQLPADFDIVSLISQIDRDHLFARDRVPDNLLIVPNGVDAPSYQPPPQALRPATEIAFIGNLHTLQNQDAVWFFVRQVLPRIRSHLPQATLRIFGPLRPAVARKLSAHAGVRVEGIVPNLGANLTTPRVGICPVRSGAGMQNKVLDYMAHGLAVVCSPVGLEGLEAREGQHLLVARTPEEWTQQVLLLLTNSELAQNLANAAATLVRERYRWELTARPLAERVGRLLQDA